MKHWPATTEVPAALPGVATPIEHRWVQTNGVTLHVALAGPEDGVPVLLLHGYPEAWFGWSHQIDALVAAGFRVAMPDQRGYNLSERPGRVSDYHIETLAADAVSLAETLGYSAWHLVGHDWGAAVAWTVAYMAPSGLRSVSILNVPEPRVMLRAATRTRQFFRSWYILAFQIPALPEMAIRHNGFRNMLRNLRSSAAPGVFDDAAAVRYIEAWSRPGAMTAMIAWYRAAFGRVPSHAASARVRVPLQILWGEKDVFLGAEMVEPSAERCDHVRVIRFPDATHWVQHEESEAVNAALIEHVRAHA